jgi:hypothetical protein
LKEENLFLNPQHAISKIRIIEYIKLSEIDTLFYSAGIANLILSINHMAVSSNRTLIQMRGHIGRLLVIRYYAQSDRIVLSAFPNMDKVMFSTAQLKNQSKFKKAVEFASKVKSSAMLCFLFQQEFGKEISVYKEAVKQYFKNPDSPLSFVLEAKMQGSSKDEPRMALPSSSKERLELAQKCLADTGIFPKTPQPVRPTRRNNSNFRKTHLTPHCPRL